MTSACSTVEPVAPALSVASYCPPETTIASPQTFRNKVALKRGETPFQTVKRFRMAEKKKNDDGARLMATYAKCRASTDEAIAKHNEELAERNKKASEGSILGGF